MKIVKFNQVGIKVDLKEKSIKISPSENVFSRITNSLTEFASSIKSEEKENKLQREKDKISKNFKDLWTKERDEHKKIKL